MESRLSWLMFPSSGGSLNVLVEVEVHSLAMDRTTDTPVLILQETGGGRLLPIWIGPAEAKAIATYMAGAPFPRPLTADLLCDMLKKLGGQVRKVLITGVEKSTYYAELVVEQNGDVISLDARPSDSIAIALRCAATLFADDSLLDHTDIEIAEGDASPGLAVDVEAGDSAEASLNADQLKEHLRAMNPEDFGRFTL